MNGPVGVPGVPGDADDPPPRTLVALDRDEALALLASVDLGRIVFTRNALPAVRPVNHALLDEDLVIRTHDGAALARTVDGGEAVVVYEADLLDHRTHLGWSVIVTGFAHLVTDPAELARFERLVRPWVAQPTAHTIIVRLDLVDGFRMVEQAPPRAPEGG